MGGGAEYVTARSAQLQNNSRNSFWKTYPPGGPHPWTACAARRAVPEAVGSSQTAGTHPVPMRGVDKAWETIRCVLWSRVNVAKR